MMVQPGILSGIALTDGPIVPPSTKLHKMCALSYSQQIKKKDPNQIRPLTQFDYEARLTGLKGALLHRTFSKF